MIEWTICLSLGILWLIATHMERKARKRQYNAWLAERLIRRESIRCANNFPKTGGNPKNETK